MKNHILLMFLLIFIFFCLAKPSYAYQTIPSYTNQTTIEIQSKPITKTPKNNVHSIKSLHWMFSLFAFLLIALGIIFLFSLFF